VSDDGAVEVAKDTFVDYELQADDVVWTVPGEFSDYPHNSIPEPDRTVDNSTLWMADFSRDYYRTMLYGAEPDALSVRNYFLEQSSGRYAVHGDVTEWVPCPGVAADYDDGDPGPGDAEHVWQVLEDSVDGWYAMQGMSKDDIDAYLKQFDVYDRYDHDGDGDFDEPDGYIDHFQSLHSGEGNEAGGGELGDDAIWSHSWYARYGDIGVSGPDFNLMGGIQIGDSDYWIGDYTIQPENGGVGVFAHEFVHDLGAPDLYDLVGGDNGVSFWSLMDSGSWLSAVDYDIGSKPDHIGAWEKLFLGWLDYDHAAAGTPSSHKLGPAEFTTTKGAQGLLVTLPDKFVEWDVGDPYAGEYFYYSGSGNYLDNWMYRQFTLPAGTTLSAKWADFVVSLLPEGWPPIGGTGMPLPQVPATS
jgi:immune inhibitor A